MIHLTEELNLCIRGGETIKKEEYATHSIESQ